MTPDGLPPIVVVEDDEAHRALIEAAFDLSRISNPLALFDACEEAMAYLENEQELPALVLLDLHIPRISGLEMLSWIRERTRFAHVPVVMLTSSTNETDVSRAYELGATSYLIKPVGFDALLDVVKTLGLYWVILNRPPEVRP